MVGGGGGQQQRRRQEPTARMQNAFPAGQKNPDHLADGEDDAGGEEQQEAERGGAAAAEFVRRDETEHVGVGLAAGVAEQVEQLRAARVGLGGELAGEGEFLGAADRDGQDVVDDVGVAAVGFGTAVGERDGQAVAPLGGDGGGDGFVAVGAEPVGMQETA